MPATVKAALKEPPICDVIRVTGRGQIVRYIEFELIKMTTLVSVGNNMNNSQVQFVATQLVELFPNESLADFKLCFSRGCMGQYGEIFRMDGIVLRKWMEQYLDEKYQVVEQELIQEKDNIYKNQKPAEPIESSEGYEMFKQYVKYLNSNKSRIAGMSEDDYKKYGKEKPVRKDAATSGYKYFQVRNVQVMALTQEDAEKIVQRMIEIGELIEDK